MLARRSLVAAALTAALALGGCSKPVAQGVTRAQADDMSLGDPHARVQVIEYASASCPHCARFATDVFPAFKAKYVDTGKVHYIFREMLVGGQQEVQVAASGFLLARCAGKDKYFAVNEAIFKNQQQAFQTPRETLEEIGKSMGMTEDQFNKCVSDETAIKALNDRVERHSRDDHVNSTPTFVINGKQLEPGYHPLEEIDAAIKAAGG
jgi:protein-disulfide isomerase